MTLTSSVSTAGANLRAASSPLSSEYTVQFGDTLNHIAARHGVSPQGLLDANPQIINPERIYPGDRLSIPVGMNTDADADANTWPEQDSVQLAAGNDYTGGLPSAAARAGGSTAPATPTPAPASASTSRAAEPEDVTKTFSPEIKALMAKSPTLQKDLEFLRDQGWAIVYGPSGGGSFYQTNRNEKGGTITLDPAHKNNPEKMLCALSHEIGHARFTYEYQFDNSSREAYINSGLTHEGAAMMKTLQVDKEIIDAGEADGIMKGTSAPLENRKLYKKFVDDGDAVSARKKIGDLYNKNEYAFFKGKMCSYTEFYGRQYDERKARNEAAQQGSRTQ